MSRRRGARTRFIVPTGGRRVVGLRSPLPGTPRAVRVMTKVHDLHKSYDGTEAVRGVSFDVAVGEVLEMYGRWYARPRLEAIRIAEEKSWL